MTPLAEQIIVEIIQKELELGVNNVWIRDQNKKIPNDEGLYCAVGMVDSSVISSVNSIVPTDAGMSEIQQVVTRDNIQIDLFSHSTAAITRRWEVITALKSFLSTQKQEENQFKIFKIPVTFVDTSSVEGGSDLNRYTIIVATHSLFRKEKVLDSDNGDYYDSFDTRVDDAKTIEDANGLIEFNIIPEV